MESRLAEMVAAHTLQLAEQAQKMSIDNERDKKELQDRMQQQVDELSSKGAEQDAEIKVQSC